MPRITEREQKDVRIWRARLERSKARREKNLAEWDENLQFYMEGHGKDLHVGPNDHEIIINKVFSTLRAQLPTLIFSHPKFYVRPRRRVMKPLPDGRTADISPELARGKEHILNYYWNELNGQFHVRLAVLSAFLAMGVCRVGYTPHFEDNPHAGEFETDGEGNIFVDGSGMPKLARGDFLRDDNGDPIIDPDSGLPLLEPGELLKNEHFFVEWVNWKNMLFDPEGTNEFNTHRWVAEEWVRPTEDIKEDALFKNRGRVRASEYVGGSKADASKPLGIDTDSFTAMDEAVRADEGRTRGYTIYDLRKRKIFVLIENPPNGKHDFFLREDDMPPEMEHGPYVFLRFNEAPGRWEPLPDVTQLKSPQEEINVLRSKVLTHIQRGDRKYLYDENSFTEEQLQQLAGGGDMALIGTNNLTAVVPVPTAPMDQAVYAALPDVDRTFDEISGQPAEARGVAKSDTATQASILENRNQMRESDRRDNIIHDFVRDIGRKLLQSMQANLTVPVWVAAGDSTLPFPFEGFITPKDLEGEADVEIQMGSMLPKTNSVMRQQFMGIMSTLSQAPFLAASPSLLERIFEMFEVENTGLANEISQMAQQQLAQASAEQKNRGPVAGLPEGEESPVAGIPTPTVAGTGGVQ